MADPVNPSHYTSHPSGVECITITEHFGFCIGNAVKYLWRAGLKGDAIEDLRKAAWYIAREIARLESLEEARSIEGTDAQQDASGFYGTGWYLLRAFDPPVVCIDQSNMICLHGTLRGKREWWCAGSGKHRPDTDGPLMRDIVAGPFDTEQEAIEAMR